MIRGSYSFIGGENGRENPKLFAVEKTPADGPFEILDNASRTGAEREAQLVAAGVAEYVGKPRKEAPSVEEPAEDVSGIPDENPEEEEKPKRTTRRRTASKATGR